MRDRDFLAERFEEERPQLRRIAYRMLGTVDEADDAVQEAWIKLSRSDDSKVENLGAWLTTVVSRVCLDMLRARRSRREEFVGSWMPEPIVAIDSAPTPEEEALIADGVGLALYVVLETLDPAERLAFVLHDMFALPFDEIARIVGRSPEAARQLASRARQTGSGRHAGAGRRARRAAASRRGLPRGRPRGRLRRPPRAARPGGHAARRRRPRQPAGAGGDRRRRHRARRGAEMVGACSATAGPAIVNGVAGAVVERRGGGLFAVVAVTVAHGRITAFDFVLDPTKLARVTV